MILVNSSSLGGNDSRLRDISFENNFTAAAINVGSVTLQGGGYPGSVSSSNNRYFLNRLFLLRCHIQTEMLFHRMDKILRKLVRNLSSNILNRVTLKETNRGRPYVALAI